MIEVLQKLIREKLEHLLYEPNTIENRQEVEQIVRKTVRQFNIERITNLKAHIKWVHPNDEESHYVVIVEE